jgi:hypothetical protein
MFAVWRPVALLRSLATTSVITDGDVTGEADEELVLAKAVGAPRGGTGDRAR